MTSLLRDNTTAVSLDVAVTSDVTSSSDDLGEFIRLMMVQPPPSPPVHVDESDVAIIPPPTEFTLDLAPTADYSGYSVLPPLVELPEDEAERASCPPPPPVPAPRVIEFGQRKMKTPNSRNAGVNSRNDQTPGVRRVSAADGVVPAAAARSSSQPVHASTCVSTTDACSVNPGVDIAASRTLIENTLIKKSTAAPPVGTSQNKSPLRSFNIPQLRRRFTGDTEVFGGGNAQKKSSANIWKRFLKRDRETGGMTSSTGFSWTLLPHRKSMKLQMQSQSIAESTATFRRRSSDLPSSSTQSRIATLAASRARELNISLPFDVRDLATGDAQRPEQPRTSSDDNEQLTSTDLRDGVRSAGHIISQPYDFRSLKTNARLRAEQRTSADGKEQLTSTDRSEVREDVVRSAAQKRNDGELDVPSASVDDVTMTSSSKRRPEVRAETLHNYRDERGRLLNTSIDPRVRPVIIKSSTLQRMSAVNNDKQTPTARNVQPTTTAATPTAGQSNHSPTSARRISLINIGATLPRIYRRNQPTGDDQSLSETTSTQGVEAECRDEDLCEATRSEYLRESVTGTGQPSPAADTELRLRRSLNDESTSSPPPPPPPLLSFHEYDELQPKWAAAGGRFDTFRGALKPMRWSDEVGNKKPRSLSVGSVAVGRQQFPAYVDVRPPGTQDVVTDARPVSALIAAPRSDSSFSTIDKDQTRKPLKVRASEKLRTFIRIKYYKSVVT